MASNGKVNQKKSKENGTDFSEIPVRMYFINFKILSNITRPSFTAIKIVENYHQVEPCRPPFEMAVPLIPIAIPMLALLRAGHHLHHHRS
jgi:hypothetical protein